MKLCTSIAVLLACALLVAPASAALVPGSIAFTGFNAEGNDNLAFVALDDLPVGTVIGFTDNEWSGTGWVVSDENGFAWTATSDVAAGTIVTLDGLGSVATFSSNLGTIAPIPGAGTDLGVSNSNEGIFAFVGPYASPTTFLTAIGNDLIASTGNVLTGTGLVDGTTAFFYNGDEDIFAYTGARSGEASFAAYQPLIYNAANWISQDGGGDQSIDAVAPDVPFSTEAFTAAVPEPTSLVALGLGLIGMTAMRSRRR